MVPRGGISVERRADRIEDQNGRALLLKTVVSSMPAELENDLTGALSDASHSSQEPRCESFRLLQANVRSSGNGGFTARAAEPEDHAAWFDRLALAPDVHPGGTRRRMSEIGDPRGDATARLVVADQQNWQAREYLRRA